MDKLTLEHLAPYLPYGLKVLDMMDNETKLFNRSYNKEENAYKLTTANLGFTLIKDFRFPLLRPLSEIAVDFFKENIDDAIVDFLINCEPENNHFSVEVCEKVIGWSALSYEEYQLFFKNHFDVFGLIEKGLAISTDTLGKEVEGE